MNVRLKHNLQWISGVYYHGDLRMNQYSATLSMITNTSNSSNHNIAFERLKYFVYDKLDSTIFINSECKEQCRLYVDAGLSVTTLPGEPVDQLIGLMLYCKLNAIMEDRIIVEETEVSSVLGESVVYLHSENELTDIVSYPKWWTSSDLEHYDQILVESDKIVSLHQFDNWQELELDWPVENEKTGNIVVFADFKNNDTE